MADQNKVSNLFVYGIMAGMLTFGTANTLIGKYLDQSKAPKNASEGCFLFVHPYLQTAFMFLGELFCFTFLAVKIWYDKNYGGPQQPHDPTKEKPRTNINPLLMAIPASCDVMGSTLMFVALTMVPASVYQMMRGLIVVITALMSIIFLGKKQYRHHWTGVGLILLGVFLVGYVSVSGSSGSESGGSEIVGILLLVVAQLFTGAMFIIEEKLLGNYKTEPFQMVGLEGMWGLCYYILLLPIMQLIACGANEYGVKSKGLGQLCNYGYLENSAFAFYQMTQSGIVVMLVVMTIVCIACFNSFGIACTKYASSAQRSTIDTSRTLTIWLMSIALGLEKFIPWEIPGFVLLSCGTLLYNEIVILPFLGFDQWTKKALAAKAEQEGKTALVADDYMAMSPHAMYRDRSTDKQKQDDGDLPSAQNLNYSTARASDGYQQ